MSGVRDKRMPWDCCRGVRLGVVVMGDFEPARLWLGLMIRVND